MSQGCSARCLVVAGSPYLAYNASLCLWLAGYVVHVLGTWRWSVYRLSRSVRRYERVPAALFEEANAPALVARIDAYCERHAIDVVLPGDVTANLALLSHRDRLRSARLFPAPSIEGFLDLHDKWAFSCVVAASGVAQPETRLLACPEDAKDFGLRFPVLVKPLRRTFGEGILPAASEEELVRHVRRCQDHGELPVLAQEYAPGDDFGLALLADHGEVTAWTVQRRSPDRGAEYFLHDEAILDAGRRLVSHMKYHGVLDLDFRRNGNGPPLAIDANPRFPGTMLYKLWAGVNLPALGVALAFGEAPQPRFAPPEGPCVNYQVSPKRLVLSLLCGRFVPIECTGYSEVAWRTHYRDPVPHYLNWLASLAQRAGRNAAPQVGDAAHGSLS